MNNQKFIITEYRRDKKQTWYVAATPGYMRCRDGFQKRDGSLKGGPEWTTNREHALEFHTHRSAAAVANKCPSATIYEILDDTVTCKKCNCKVNELALFPGEI